MQLRNVNRHYVNVMGQGRFVVQGDATLVLLWGNDYRNVFTTM